MVNETRRNDKRQLNLNQNIKLFCHKNSSENIVCKMVAILSWNDELKWVSEECSISQQPQGSYRGKYKDKRPVLFT